MKKILSAVLAVLMLLSVFAVGVCAKDNSGWAGTITVNGESRTYIRNEFYQLYHDDLFETVYAAYKDGRDNGIAVYKEISSELSGIVIVPFESLGKIDDGLLNEIKSSEDTYYLTVYLNYDEDFSEEKNTELLGGIDAEILYTGATTPCAIIVADSKNIDNVLECENIEYVNYAFFTFPTDSMVVIPENGNRTYKPDAAHARKVLRYSAGLYSFEDCTYLQEIKEFLIMSDTNFDGKITASDARDALRIAAGLDEPIEFTHRTDSFWGSI